MLAAPDVPVAYVAGATRPQVAFIRSRSRALQHAGMGSSFLRDVAGIRGTLDEGAAAALTAYLPRIPGFDVMFGAPVESPIDSWRRRSQRRLPHSWLRVSGAHGESGTILRAASSLMNTQHAVASVFSIETAHIGRERAACSSLPRR